MEDALTVITAAVVAGGAAGTTETSKTAVTDAYRAFKKWALRHSAGASDDLEAALDEYEKARAKLDQRLAEHLKSAGLHRDADAVAEAQKVLADAGARYRRISISNSDVVSVDQKGDIKVRIDKRRR